MKQTLLNHIKNIPGWRTPRKLVVFSVDDYGNVRLDSKKARKNMDKAGLKVHSRFDAYDTLETRADLEALFEVLTSVKDKNDRHAVFTPFALPCNINFERMAEEDYQQYRYEKLPVTYTKLAESDPDAYKGSWDIWKEGIEQGFMVPQFHGREHLNLKVFNQKISNRDQEVMTALRNRSYTSISSSGIPHVGYTASFAFEKEQDINVFPEILKSGTDAFEEVFGFRSESFTPPAQQFPKVLEKKLSEYGIRHLDKPFIRNRHLGEGRYIREINVRKRDSKLGLNIIVRNVVFEPTNGHLDHVGKALKQVEAAFFWHKPAIISSHRVNFCGHIDESNRKTGLIALKDLLQRIVRKWPQVEFISANQLYSLNKNK